MYVFVTCLARYATQAELKSVPLKIISSMSKVPTNVSERARGQTRREITIT